MAWACCEEEGQAQGKTCLARALHGSDRPLQQAAQNPTCSSLTKSVCQL
jgi:hypothetical protein